MRSTQIRTIPQTQGNAPMPAYLLLLNPRSCLPSRESFNYIFLFTAFPRWGAASAGATTRQATHTAVNARPSYQESLVMRRSPSADHTTGNAP